MGRMIVTGANGFIGSHLVNFLLVESDDDIVAVDLQVHLNENYIQSHPRIQFTSVEQFYNNLDDYCDAKVIFHIGAISSTVETSWQNINLYNIYLSKVLIHFAIAQNTPLIFASSASLYGHEINFDEDSVGQFFSQYAYSKRKLDEYIQYQISNNHLAALTSLRFFNVYGENESHKMNQASPYLKFKKQAIEEGIIRLFKGSGDFLRDFISVNDVVYCCWKAFQSNAYGVYNVGTGRAVSFQDIATKIALRYHAKIEWIDMPDELKRHYQIYTKAEMSALLNQIGEMDFVNIMEAI